MKLRWDANNLELTLGSGNGLLQSGNKALSMPLLTTMFVAIWRHYEVMGYSDPSHILFFLTQRTLCFEGSLSDFIFPQFSVIALQKIALQKIAEIWSLKRTPTKCDPFSGNTDKADDILRHGFFHLTNIFPWREIPSKCFLRYNQSPFNKGNGWRSINKSGNSG